MNWKFWKKQEPEPKPEEERFYIPEEHIEKVLELADIYNSLPGGQDRVARFRLWRKIFNSLEGFNEDDIEYTLYTTAATMPYVVRKS